MSGQLFSHPKWGHTCLLQHQLALLHCRSLISAISLTARSTEKYDHWSLEHQRLIHFSCTSSYASHNPSPLLIYRGFMCGFCVFDWMWMVFLKNLDMAFRVICSLVFLSAFIYMGWLIYHTSGTIKSTFTWTSSVIYVIIKMKKEKGEENNKCIQRKGYARMEPTT